MFLLPFPNGITKSQPEVIIKEHHEAPQTDHPATLDPGVLLLAMLVQRLRDPGPILGLNDLAIESALISRSEDGRAPE